MGATSARILLVEDENAPGRTATSALEALGHQVLWVRSVREARQRLGEGGWDVLVLDVSLDSDGLEYFQALRFAPEHPRGGVVIMTEPGDVQTKERAKQLGAAGVVAKPLVPDELAGVVQDLLAFI
ncbi:MAG: response regulator [Candidatus Dormibacteria bacterium]